jgi:hypothetical protein
MTPELTNGLFALAGAVGGAVITGAIAWRQARALASRKELTVVSTRPAKLLEVDRTVRGIVEIRIGGRLVPTLYMSSVALQNSGNQEIESIEAVVQIKGSCEILNAEVADAPSGVDPLTMSPKVVDAKSVSISVAYLNPGETLSVRLLLSDKPEKISVNCRQKGVSVLTREDFDPTQPGAAGRVFYEALGRNALLHWYLRLVLPSYRRFWENEQARERGLTRR